MQTAYLIRERELRKEFVDVDAGIDLANSFRRSQSNQNEK